MEDFGGGLDYTGWKPTDIDIRWLRTVVAVGADGITLDAPVTTALSQRFGGAFVQKVTHDGAISECGIENLGIDAAAFECHCEIVPAEGADVNILMGANGEQDEETGVITVYLLGVLTTQADGSYTIEGLGTGW